MTKTLHFCNKAETYERVKHFIVFSRFVLRLYKMLKSPSINLKEKKNLIMHAGQLKLDAVPRSE